MKKTLLLSVLFLTLFNPSTNAKVIVRTVEYKQKDAILEGAVAYDTRFKGKRPGVLVVHEWTGLGTYVKMRIQKLAELGYVAFAADIYGKGVRPNNPKDAATTATIYKSNRPLLRERAQAALDQLLKQDLVDTKRVAAMGYCFGGTTILELARSGAPLSGFVSFHGALDTPSLTDAKAIKGEVLAFHGADDPYVPAKDVETFEKEMRDAGVKWELVKFGGAVHSFTNPEAGNDNSKGAAYNQDADLKSWEEMKLFLSRVFASKK